MKATEEKKNQQIINERKTFHQNKKKNCFHRANLFSGCEKKIAMFTICSSSHHANNANHRIMKFTR